MDNSSGCRSHVTNPLTRCPVTGSVCWCLVILMMGLIAATGVGNERGGAFLPPHQRVGRQVLAGRIALVDRLRTSPQLAQLLSDSIPESIVQDILELDSTLVGLTCGCVFLDSTACPTGAGFPGQRLYVFSGRLSSLYTIVVEHDSGTWRAVWSRTDPGCLPQPRIWRTCLGIEGDSSVTIGMKGLVSATAYKSYSLMLWNGRTGTDLFRDGGDWIEEIDLNHDGVIEVIIGREERHAGKNHPASETYYLDAASRTYRSTRDTSGTPRQSKD